MSDIVSHCCVRCTRWLLERIRASCARSTFVADGTRVTTSLLAGLVSYLAMIAIEMALELWSVRQYRVLIPVNPASRSAMLAIEMWSTERPSFRAQGQLPADRTHYSHLLTPVDIISKSMRTPADKSHLVCFSSRTSNHSRPPIAVHHVKAHGGVDS